MNAWITYAEKEYNEEEWISWVESSQTVQESRSMEKQRRGLISRRVGPLH